MQVVVNHHVQLSDEEMKQAHEKAKKSVEEEQIAKLKKRPKKNVVPTKNEQTSLF
jgi:hypothetical protein